MLSLEIGASAAIFFGDWVPHGSQSMLALLGDLFLGEVGLRFVLDTLQAGSGDEGMGGEVSASHTESTPPHTHIQIHTHSPVQASEGVATKALCMHP